ncbi:MAG: hypothetical protein JWO94_2558 [Verrucomicrobiaceae bacterium]|nr:hypothetical protein [Verrucomicrobiaceae bacterium]
MSAQAAQRESLWQRWVVNPVTTQLSQGLEPRKVTLAIAFGVTLGLFPLLGLPTLVSLAVGIPLKLNQPVLQAFRELTYPLQLSTILLFIRGGEWLFHVPHTALSVPGMLHQFFASPARFMSDFGLLGLYAVVVWGLIAPVLLALIYFPVLPLIERLSKRLALARHAP